MMMVVMMIVMLPRRMRGRLQTRRNWGFRLKGWGIFLGNATDGAEPILCGILTAAGKAGSSLGGFGRGVGGGIRIHLRSQSLHRLQRGCDRFRARLGMMHVLLQSPKEIVYRGIVAKFSLRW